MKALQLVLLTAVIATLVALAFFSSDISRSASKDIKLFSSAELSSTSFIVVQRESLAYTTRYTQWLGGDIERREVQIARALLAQRLNVVTSSRLTIDQQLSQRYFENLAKSDRLLASSQPGYLPSRFADTIRNESKAFIDAMLLETRSLVAIYQDALHQLLEKSALNRNFKAKRLLYVLYLFFVLSLMLFALFAYTLGRQHRRNSIANSEQLRLISESTGKLADSRLVVDQLELLDERKNIFISTVNHELRTPLTLIVGYIDILREKFAGVNDEGLTEIVDVLERNSNNLLDLVQDILSLTNLESGSIGLLKSEVDLKEIAGDSILLLSPLAEAAQVSITLEIEEGLQTRILANRSQFLEVITNLLGNAIKFSRRGGAILISIDKGLSEKTIRMLQISVSDEGIGIPEPELNQVFSSFFRASNVRNSEIKGTGLGLAIISRIIEEHQGNITVESTLNVGTTFRVKVPVFVLERDELI